MPASCTRCGRATRDAYLCTICLVGWRDALHAAAEFARDAPTYRARLGTTWRFGSGSRSAVLPLPYDPRVSPVLKELGELASQLPKGRLSGKRPDAPRLAAKTHELLGRMLRIIDNPPELVYLGACGEEGCEASLYVEAGEGYIRCPKCKHQHQVSERRAILVGQLHDYLATVSEISRLLKVTLERNVSEQSIQRLVNKGVLVSKGHRVKYDALGRPRRSAVYRVGDVLGLDMEYAQRSKP